MSRTSIAAIAAAWLILAGCGDTSSQQPDAGSAPVTERRAVSPDGVSLASPTELGVDVPSCNGDPVVDELVEDDEQVGLRIVTTVVVSGDGNACADALPVTLEEPLGERTLIDLVSGEELRVRPLPEADTGSLAAAPEELLGRSFVTSSILVDGEPYQPVNRPLAVRFDGDNGDRIGISWEAGCNVAGGQFDAAPDRFEPHRSPDGKPAFDTTEMGCEQPEHEQDRWLADVFAAGPTWELDGDTLLLTTDSVEMVLDEGPWPRG